MSRNKYESMSLEELQEDTLKFMKRYRRVKIFINVFEALATLGLVAVFVLTIKS